jgi:hypothetical protein
MQTPYEIGDTLYHVRSWNADIQEATVSMMTIKADKTWKIRLSFLLGNSKCVYECKLEEINKAGKYGGVFDNYALALECLNEMREDNI